jgi:hypothetical protein
MGQKAPQGPASHPLGFETDVGRRKSAALIFLILFSSRKKECLAASYMVAEKIGLFSNGKLLPVFLGPTVDIGVPEITRFDTSNTIGVYQNSWIISCPWLDVEDQSKQNFTQIFPNPTTGMVNIVWHGNHSVSRLRIINSIGQIIETANPVNSDQTQLNLSHLATGVYYVEILFDDNKRLVEKITLNR